MLTVLLSDEHEMDKSYVVKKVIHRIRIQALQVPEEITSTQSCDIE